MEAAQHNLDGEGELTAFTHGKGRSSEESRLAV
jgi:hypothetical protein